MEKGKKKKTPHMFMILKTPLSGNLLLEWNTEEAVKVSINTLELELINIKLSFSTNTSLKREKSDKITQYESTLGQNPQIFNHIIVSKSSHMIKSIIVQIRVNT